MKNLSKREAHGRHGLPFFRNEISRKACMRFLYEISVFLDRPSGEIVSRSMDELVAFFQ